MKQAVLTFLGTMLASVSLGMAQAPDPASDGDPAQGATEPAPAARLACPPGIGCVTRQPLPRFVSLKGAEARARRGPGSDHRVDWVYQRPGLPMKVTAEYENWRRVEDHEGVGGWMHYALLSSSRTAITTHDMAEIRSKPESGAMIVAQSEAGAILRLLECEPEWCRIAKDGVRGWLPKAALWGVLPQETFD